MLTRVLPYFIEKVLVGKQKYLKYTPDTYYVHDQTFYHHFIIHIVRLKYLMFKEEELNDASYSLCISDFSFGGNERGPLKVYNCQILQLYLKQLNKYSLCMFCHLRVLLIFVFEEKFLLLWD